MRMTCRLRSSAEYGNTGPVVVLKQASENHSPRVVIRSILRTNADGVGHARPTESLPDLAASGNSAGRLSTASRVQDNASSLQVSSRGDACNGGARVRLDIQQVGASLPLPGLDV